MNVVITTQNLQQHSQPISDEAAELVRMSFNPSADQKVEVIKALSAALIAACEDVANANSAAGRHAALAKTAAEEAGMWGVKAATTGL